MENPARPGEPRRGAGAPWFASDDRDFVIHVHAALVTAEGSLERSHDLRHDLPRRGRAVALSLPAQRSFALRREYVARVIAEHV
jgi:hypothetical protein